MTCEILRRTRACTTNLRSVVVFTQSEKIVIAPKDMTPPPLQAGDSTFALAQAVSDLQAGQMLVVSGMAPGAAASDPAISEVAAIKSVSPDGMTITLSTSLQNSYDPTTVSINANVALATHGETVANEVLGSGDASQPYQQFTLRQSPLTYTSSSNASGAESTLQVRVNDIEWHEVPTLYGHGPRERIFVTNTGDDQKTTIEFGDGVTGARPASGQENIRARYRKGTGTAGLVKAGQLSLLMTRPLGVKAVTNPLDASGAADPEGLDASGATDANALTKARLNVPLTVLTLDRIVSLQDYEDFARAFAGIAKALATWTWSGQVRGVFVTVAGPNGEAINEGSQTYDNLLAAMQMAGDPYVPVRVQTYRQDYFRMAARVKVDPDYLQDLVLAAVEKALRDAFSFDARAFGQPVTQSEVIATMQAVPGVVAVDLYKLYRPFHFIFFDLERNRTLNSIHFFPPGMHRLLNDVLVAAVPQPGGRGGILAAELLTLDPAPLDDLGSDAMSFDTETLYALLPAIYRIRDAGQGEPLKALLAVIAEQIEVGEENLAQLYDDQFIETCAGWVIPYIGDLIGYHGLYDIRPGAGTNAGTSTVDPLTVARRAEVANTIGFRRRKGTVAMLEELARSTTNWSAHVVEFFQLLATTQYMKHLRPKISMS